MGKTNKRRPYLHENAAFKRQKDRLVLPPEGTIDGNTTI